MTLAYGWSLAPLAKSHPERHQGVPSREDRAAVTNTRKRCVSRACDVQLPAGLRGCASKAFRDHLGLAARPHLARQIPGRSTSHGPRSPS